MDNYTRARHLYCNPLDRESMQPLHHFLRSFSLQHPVSANMLYCESFSIAEQHCHGTQKISHLRDAMTVKIAAFNEAQLWIKLTNRITAECNSSNDALVRASCIMCVPVWRKSEVLVLSSSLQVALHGVAAVVSLSRKRPCNLSSMRSGKTKVLLTQKSGQIYKESATPT